MIFHSNISTTALVVGVLGVAVIVWVCIWLMLHPQTKDLRTMTEWEDEFSVRIATFEGFRPEKDGIEPILKKMSQEEFLLRLSRSGFAPIHRTMSDIGIARRQVPQPPPAATVDARAASEAHHPSNPPKKPAGGFSPKNELRHWKSSSEVPVLAWFRRKTSPDRVFLGIEVADNENTCDCHVFLGTVGSINSRTLLREFEHCDDHMTWKPCGKVTE